MIGNINEQMLVFLARLSSDLIFYPASMCMVYVGPMWLIYELKNTPPLGLSLCLYLRCVNCPHEFCSLTYTTNKGQPSAQCNEGLTSGASTVWFLRIMRILLQVICRSILTQVYLVCLIISTHGSKTVDPAESKVDFNKLENYLCNMEKKRDLLWSI